MSEKGQWLSAVPQPPPGVRGFGNCLLWLLMTRAAEVVYDVYENGPANRMGEYLWPGGRECLPTQAAIAWLILAGQQGIAPGRLPHRDRDANDLHHRLRAQLNGPLHEQSRDFKDEWIHGLAASCGLTRPEVWFLKQCRLQEGDRLDPGSVREAVERTRSEGIPQDRGEPWTSPGQEGPGEVGLMPRMLLRDIESFTGREAELERLVAAGSRAGGTPGVVTVHAIEGMGGIGKTALVLRAAHLIAAEFPDGQLFLDLKGYTPGVAAATPDEALRQLLFHLGVPDSKMDDTITGLAALYRSLLAGKRVLVVLDNAATLSQVEPLLPATAGCLVMITSRHPIGLAGARVVPLGTPSPEEAARLFRAAAGPEIIADEDPNVPAILELCGHLPLAISILAARLARGHFRDTQELLIALRAEHGRLAEMADGDRNVTATFELSYQRLPEHAQRLFRRLGLIPGADFDTRAVMSLYPAGEPAQAGQPAAEDEILGGLRLLREQNLLIQAGQGRYKFHDLLRAFARQKAREFGEPGLDGFLDFYLYCAQAADALLDERTPTALPPRAVPVPRQAPELRSISQAWAWLTTEIANLDAAVREAVRHRQDAQAVALSAALAEFLRASGRWPMASELHQIAAGAATRLADTAGLAGALTRLGVVERQTGDLTGALDTLTQAVTAGRDGRVPLALAGALLELGITQRITDEPGAAGTTLTEARKIYQDAGSLLGQACTSRELGGLQRQAGDFTAAEWHLREASNLYHAMGDRQGQTTTLLYLGGVWLGVRRYQSASEALTTAVGILRESTDADLGDRGYLANGLLYLGMAQIGTGALEAALASLSEGHEIVKQLHERRMEAGFLAFLGKAYWLSGEHPRAEQSFTTALDIFQAVKDSGGETETWNLYGEYALATGDPAQARERYEKALALARQIESRRDEADALEGVARCHLASAAGDLRAALDLFERMDCLDDAARIRSTLAALDTLPGT
jgi:tetratricopeptide (TPR) repeat protein